MSGSRRIGLAGLIVSGVLLATWLPVCAAQAGGTATVALPHGDVVVGSATAPEAGHISVRGHDLEIGASTVAGVRRAEGRKPTSDLPLMGRTGVVGRMLTYEFTVGKGVCTHEYGFPPGGKQLSQFVSDCPPTRTFNRARVGMNVMKAEALTGVGFRFDGVLGNYTCMLDNPAMVQAGPGALIVAWSNVADASQGGSARITSIGAYGDQAPLWQAGFCEPTP